MHICVLINRAMQAAKELKAVQENQERGWDLHLLSQSIFFSVKPFHLLLQNIYYINKVIKYLSTPAGDSGHRRPRGTSRKWWLKGTWIGNVSMHVSVGQISRFIDSNIMRHATVCLAVVKGKRGEKGPPGKQGSPVSNSHCHIISCCSCWVPLCLNHFLE